MVTWTAEVCFQYAHARKIYLIFETKSFAVFISEGLFGAWVPVTVRVE